MSAGNSRHRIRREDKQKALIILSILFFIIAAGGYFISRWENKRYATAGGQSNVPVDPVFSDPEKVEINGAVYIKKNKVRSYLIMGCDTEGEVITRKNGGQADVQILVVVDDEAKTWRMLPIDRASMVLYDILDESGKSVGVTDGQITLAHAYGSWEDGSRNVTRAVSHMLADQRIDGYFDMNMEAVPILNDAVGGVTVRVDTDFSGIDDSLKMGEEVTLTGEQAVTFVRLRKTVDDGTNAARMKRQETYLRGLIKQLKRLSSDEILDLYDNLMDYSVTNMGSGDIVDLADMAREYTQLENIEIEGTYDDSGRFRAFEIDEDSLQHVILELFYTRESKEG